VLMAHVFLSYVREDASMVDQLAAELSSGGIDVWMDRQSIKPGQRWDLAILDAIRSGDFFVACFSEKSLGTQRSVMNRELGLAVEELTLRPLKRAWFIPVLLSPCEIPELSIGGNATLRSIQFVSLYSHWQDGIEKILDAVSPNRPQRRGSSRNARMLEAIRLLDGSSDGRRRGVPLVSAFGRDAVPPLIKAIKVAESNKSDLNPYIECLGEIGPAAAAAVPAIIKCSQIRGTHSWTTYQALGKIGGPDALRTLSDAFLALKGTEIADTVLLALGHTGDPFRLADFDWRTETLAL
jgi:hypothetical protein